MLNRFGIGMFLSLGLRSVALRGCQGQANGLTGTTGTAWGKRALRERCDKHFTALRCAFSCCLCVQLTNV